MAWDKQQHAKRMLARNELSERELRELHHSLVLGYATAAVTSTLAVLTVNWGHLHAGTGLLVLAGVEILIALVLAVVPAMPEAAVKFFAFPVPVVLISIAVAVAQPVGPAAIYYLWPALTCGHFGSRRDARLVIGLLCVGFAVGLALGHGVEVPVITYIAVVSVFVLVLVGYQYSRAQSVALTAELEHAASTDSLTGLLNRRAFGEAFAREVERATKSGLSLSVVIFDLDHFKEVNDALGHSAGDETLIAFADILRAECSNRTDVLGRMGGEEFAVVLFDTDGLNAQRVADGVAHSLADWSRERPTFAPTGPLTTSAGIAALSTEDPTPAELLVSADRALYAAKRAGRNRVVRAGDPASHVLAAVA